MITVITLCLNTVPMNTITAKEAKLHFGQLLRKVQQEPMTITKNGQPVAVMLNLDSPEVIDAVQEAIDDCYWGSRARQAEAEGYLSAEESRQLLDNCLNA